jgi:DNA-directed RNA polymerase subunit RPC12/RpoP
MAARTPTAPDGTSRPKAVLFCPQCDHESPLPGDWLISEADVDTVYACPTCGTTIVEQPRPITTYTGRQNDQ